jgi:hypothetical protein
MGERRDEEKTIPVGVAACVMAALVIAGGGVIWRYLYRPARPVPAVRVSAPAPGGPRVAGGKVTEDPRALAEVLEMEAEAGRPDGVYPRAGQVLFKAGDAYFRVMTAEGEERYSFGFFTMADVEWEHGYLSQGVRRMVADREFAREVGVSEKQLDRLGDLPEAPGAKWPAGDRERLMGMYRNWVKAENAEKVRVGNDLSAALRVYGEKRRSADDRVMAERVKAIRTILDERQVARINPVPRWEVPATTRSTGKGN